MLRKLFLSWILLGVFGSIFSQTPLEKSKIISQTNVFELEKISNLKKIEFYIQKQNALEIAKIKGWDEMIQFPDGRIAELIRVDFFGNPVYYMMENRGAGITSRAHTLYNGGNLGLNIQGQNMMAAIWDGGYALPSHELFTGRITVMDATGNIHDHSTHVAGTIIGTDGVQNGNARGMAFQSTLQSWDWNNDVSEVASAAANGLLISNHSYGYDPSFSSLFQFGKYDQDAFDFDNIMFNSPYFLMVKSAGNTRDDGINTGDNGYDLLLGSANSKNNIVVGAVEEVQNYTDPSSVIMSYFSSWGPTDDGRIKPDIVAKGVDMYSSVADSNASYEYYNGTSMSSPSVAGTLLLLQQYYNQIHSQYMKSATLRGLALHTADEAGSNNGPDYQNGWGLLNAEKAAQLISNNGLFSFISEQNLSQSNSFNLNVNASGTEPLMASICWTDPAGVINNDNIVDSNIPSIINDLDIKITQIGTEYFPWKLNPATPSSAATKGNNSVDNFEKIQIDNPEGSYNISVTHKGNLQNLNQNYSLIISGISLNEFYISSNDLSKSICIGDPMIAYNLHLNTVSGFTDTVNFTAVGLPDGVNAQFAPSSMNASGIFILNLTNLNSLNAGVYSFSVVGSTLNDSYEIDLELKVFSPSFPVQTLLSPLNNETGISLNPVFNWAPNSNAENYIFQLASDAAFSNIMVIQTVENDVFELLSNLNYNTTYYWRVKPNNLCGEGPFSNTYQFTTYCIEPTNLIANTITHDQATISWLDNVGATQWEIEVVLHGVVPTGSGVVINNNPHTLIGLNSFTQYDVYVRSFCGTSNVSNWSSVLTFTTSPDYCNGDHFYDTGGPTGDYLNNANDITTIFPSEGYNSLSVHFNSFFLMTGDYIAIYDGPDANATFIGSYTGSYSPGTILSNNPTGALTFEFVSDNSISHPGWDATVTCQYISCPKPSLFSITYITDTTAQLNWTAGSNETQWQIEYGPTGFTQGNGSIITVNTNPAILTGLSSLTSYDVYLRAVCGTNPEMDDSEWIGPKHFTTCILYTAPYSYDVETQNGSSYSQLGNCWYSNPSFTAFKYRWNATESSNTPTYYTGASFAHSGTHFFYTEASSGSSGSIAELVTPLINISNLNVPYLTFYSHLFGADINALHVDVKQNGIWNNDILVLTGQQQTSATAPWNENNVYLNGYSGNIQVRFRAIRGNGEYGDICLDDISITEGLLCPIPSQLSISNITGTTVQVSWTAGYNETQWQIEYGPTGFTQGNGSVVTVNTNPSTLTGLSSLTPFDVYLRAVCETNPGVVESEWIGPISFTTLCGVYPAPYSYNVETQNGTFYSQIGNCWSSNPSNTSTSYRWNVTAYNDTPTYYTGASFAHSGTHFFYTEADNGYSNSIAELVTPVIDVSNLNVPYLTFYSHLYGTHINALHVDVSQNGIWNNDILVLTGQQQNTEDAPWRENNIFLYGYSGNIQVRFRAIRGVNYLGDICLDDISITEGPSCPIPLQLSVSNITESTAQVQWTAGYDETQWQLEYGPTGFSQGNGSVITLNTNSSILTDLSSFTQYDVYVRAVCGTNPGVDDSVWVGPVNFVTLPIYCNGDHFYDTGGPTGNYQNNANYTTTIYPDLGFNSLSLYFNTFNLELGHDFLSIYNGPDTNSTFMGSYTGSNNPGTILSNNPTGALTFRFTSDNFYVYAGWDATFTCQFNSCPTPSHLFISNITDATAQVNWTAASDQTQWQLEYGPTGFIPGNGSVITVNTNPSTLTGLSFFTTYDVYLRAICGTNPGTDDSLWIGPISFTTLCSEVSIFPWTENFDAIITPAIPTCWKKENGDWKTTTNSASSLDADARSGTQFLRESNTATNEYIWTQKFYLLEGFTYYFSFWWAGDNNNGWQGDVFVNNVQNSVGASQLGSSFVSNSITTTKTYAEVIRSFTPSVTGNYSFAIRVNAAISNYYLSFDDFNLYVNTVSISDHFIDGFKMYPNPADEILYMEALNQFNQIVIYDMLGIEMMKLYPNSNQIQLNVAPLSSGAYVIKVNTDSQIGAYNFIKK